jgi:tetratricopeptide (TPR) repeat protein
MKSIVFFLAFLCVSSSILNAQDQLVQAFSKSLEYEAKGDYNQAITALRSVYDSKSYEVNLRMGWLHYSSAQYTEALSFYEKSILLKPYSIESKLGYVYPAAALGNWNAVIDQYKKILEIDPQNSTANYRMGYIEYNNKRYSNAYKYFEKLVNLYPFGYDGLLMFAWTNFQLGKTRDAKVLFQKVLMYAPTDKSALEGLSYIK